MEWGLINRVVAGSELRAATYRMAQEISQSSPFTLSIGKQAFYAQIDMEQPKAYAYAREVMTVNAMADDAQEGMGAFIEKRTPCWRGR
jgi:enoyl-CoA hydratase/carnithine racemase